MKIRTYKDSDFDQLLPFLNANNDLDEFNETLLKEKLCDDPAWNPETCYIAEDEQGIVGFMQGVIRDVRGTRYGYIKLMAVDMTVRRQGIARQMYQLLEKEFVKQNVDAVRIYDVPLNYFMPGIDPHYTPALCFAERMGFKRFGDTSNLLVSLNQDWSTAEKEAELLRDNIVVSRATHAEYEEVMELIDAEWPLWRNEVETAYQSDPVALHIARLNGKVRAFSAHNGNNVGTGWFGPMGTHPDLRGKGIGGVLLYRCLQDMKDWGLPNSIIPWVGPIDFYSHYANAVVDRVFWRYEKILKQVKTS